MFPWLSRGGYVPLHVMVNGLRTFELGRLTIYD